MDELKEKTIRKRLAIKKRKKREQRLKSKRIRKERFQKIKEDNFSIIQNENENKNNLQIEHANVLYKYGLTKIFKKFLIIETVVDNLSFVKNKTFSDLDNCSEIKDLNYISDNNEIMKSRIKSYIIEYFNKDENGIIAKNKIKYNDSEIGISINEIGINLEKRKKKKNDKISENGIPINALKLGKKIISKKISNAEKVKFLINCIQKDNIMEQIIEGKKISRDSNFCINCYEYYSDNDSINHKYHFNLNLSLFKDIENELDYDENLKKLYDLLKKEKNKILKNANINLINYYKQLLFSLYDIIINDNSYEELYSSIIDINENYLKEKKLGSFSYNLEILFLIFCQKISILAYLKAQEISINESLDETDLNFDELNEERNDFDEFSNEDKKKYFFELGFSLKNKNYKNICISELYNKVKEENILLNDYKNFYDKEFNIQNE